MIVISITIIRVADLYTSWKAVESASDAGAGVKSAHEE